MKKLLIGTSFFLLLAGCSTFQKDTGHNSRVVSKGVEAILPEKLPFQLSLKGNQFINQEKAINIQEFNGESQLQSHSFIAENGKKYLVDIRYKGLASNRSFPTNLDITLKNNQGEKLGYLFFAINHISFLKEMGEFGLIVNDNGDLIDVNFDFADINTGLLSIDELSHERFIQDTLLPSKNFQMIRPVVLDKISSNTLSKGFSLDSHPFNVNYTIKQLNDGVVQFQHNLSSTQGADEKLLLRIYYNANSLKVLREGMFAGKYFDKDYGAFKLVYYPAMGQLEP